MTDLLDGVQAVLRGRPGLQPRQHQRRGRPGGHPCEQRAAGQAGSEILADQTTVEPINVALIIPQTINEVAQ